MKMLIITMHRGNNFGSALQVYALSEVVKSLKCDPDVLDYIPQRINFQINLRNNLSQLFSKGGLRAKYNIIRGIAILVSSQWIYNRFFKKHLHLTKPYYSNEMIKDAHLSYDIYMTGSDQVWNSIHNQAIEYPFFLDFAPIGKPRIAYAASFGKVHLDSCEIKETQRLLSTYQAISVREESALSILASLGLKGTHVLDPTLLLPKEEWMKRIPSLSTKEKYLLIYSVEPNKQELIEYANLIAKRLHLRIYLVEWGFKKYPGVDRMISFIDPLQLMAYFVQAEYIITSSFHGTAFSVNLNKQFISITPKRFNTRVESLLTMMNLIDRLMDKNSFDIDKAIQTIDYVPVNKKLDEQRESSISFLKQFIFHSYESHLS